MKTIKISDEAYKELVRIAAKLSLENGTPHSFNDAVEELLKRCEGSQTFNTTK